MTTKPSTLTAANDNPGGATSTNIRLTAFVTVMAKAYVAARKKDSVA
ncbi:hypothetical protein O4G76_17690 [Limimaricola sp. G21655-S1]|nr:hypothetical protein [Limimaricola sp. G21655-S1]MCZ4262672.1 hypothetical protein [Limimaricola sp. G21655-S1]